MTDPSTRGHTARALRRIGAALALGPGLSHHHRTVLLLLGAATLFEGYDRFIISLALPYIGRDLGASEAALGWSLSLIRLGALSSIALGWAADRYGRRRVLLFTVLGYTLATAATGFSRGLGTFVAFQLVATIFLTAELVLAQVVIAEEFPAKYRGRGQGMLGAFAALGAGGAAMLFPLLQATPLGWRGLYFVGLAPLLLVAHLRRRLPETRRWHRQITASPEMRTGLAELLRPGLRSRFLALNALAGSATFVAGAAFGFASYRATNTFGWSPAEVSGMIIAGGAIGMSGWFVLGRSADVVGRRVTGSIAMFGSGLAVAAFYGTPWLLPSFALLVFMEAGVAIALNTLGTELFPTRLRATAKSWLTNAGIVGSMLGLAAVGATSNALGGASTVILILALIPMIAAPFLFMLPETRGAELEDLAD